MHSSKMLTAFVFVLVSCQQPAPEEPSVETHQFRVELTGPEGVPVEFTVVERWSPFAKATKSQQVVVPYTHNFEGYDLEATVKPVDATPEDAEIKMTLYLDGRVSSSSGASGNGSWGSVGGIYSDTQ